MPLVLCYVSMDLLHWVLTENDSVFDDVIYNQINGAAMGNPTAVSSSNIFLDGVKSPLRRYIGYSTNVHILVV
jgi:hypothetical protein